MAYDENGVIGVEGIANLAKSTRDENRGCLKMIISIVFSEIFD